TRLEPAHEELAGVLLEIRTGIGIAEDGKRRGQSGDLLGDDVEVLGGVEWNGDARPAADLARPHTGTVHHRVRAYFALRRHDSRHAAGWGTDPGHGEALDDAHAGRARAARERLRRVDRVGLAIFRQEDRAEESLRREERPALPRRTGREHVHFEAEA